jgi:protein required for attachment to host cells
MTATISQWIVVANGSRATFYSRNPEDEDFKLVLEATFAHPESRAKGMELVTDRPGAVRGHGSDSTQYVPHLDPKRNELEHFAMEVAQALEHAHAAGGFGRLTLVASNPFLGILRSHLAPQVLNAVDAQFAHDYTTLPERELCKRLVEHLSVAE